MFVLHHRALLVALAVLLISPALGQPKAPPPPPLDRHDLNTYLVRARYCYRIGQRDESLAVLKRALAVDPTFVPAHHFLAGLYLNERQYALALTHYRKEAQLQPKDPRGWFGVAEASFAQRRYPAAAQALQSVLKIAPTNARAHAKLGVIYASQRYSDKALREYRTALKLDANSDATHYYIGDLLRKLSRTDEALPHLQQAIALNPTVALYYQSLGELYLQQQHTPNGAERALEAFQRAIDRNPRLPGAHYGMGLIYQRQQRWKEAERALNNALYLYPDYGQAHYALSGVLRKLGKSQEAQRHLAAFRKFRAEHVQKPGESPPR